MAAKDPVRRREVARMGGAARAVALKKDRRSEIAAAGARARWQQVTVPPAVKLSVMVPDQTLEDSTAAPEGVADGPRNFGEAPAAQD